MTFPRIPPHVPLGHPRWRESLLAKAESIRNDYRPRRGWLMDKKVERKQCQN